MTTVARAPEITGTIPSHNGVLRVGVEVIDVKIHRGRKMLLVRPLAGSGEVWVLENTFTRFQEVS